MEKRGGLVLSTAAIHCLAKQRPSSDPTMVLELSFFSPIRIEAHEPGWRVTEINTQQEGLRPEQHGRLGASSQAGLCREGIAYSEEKVLLKVRAQRASEGKHLCQWLSDSHQGDSRELRTQGAVSLAVSALDSEWQL